MSRPKISDRRWITLPKNYWPILDEIARREKRENGSEIIRQLVRKKILECAEEYGLDLPPDLAEVRDVIVSTWGKPVDKKRS